MEWIILAGACLWLAWNNGANDNFIGVATLYGSRTCGYRTALIWATAATAAGSMVSVLFASLLVERFSGAALLGDTAAGLPLLIAVAGAAAITKMLATRLGMPASTTHALLGGLLGAGLASNPAGINWAELNGGFVQPLLFSPVLAAGVTAIAYIGIHRLRRQGGIGRETCVCVGCEQPAPVTVLADGRLMLKQGDGAAPITMSAGTLEDCVERYQGGMAGVNAQSAVDAVHYLSGGAVCFARAVSDTPKIAALLLAVGMFGTASGTVTVLLMVTAAMTLGGWFNASRVADTMSNRISGMNGGQGLTANIITAGLVLSASRFGLPVSTTHVACSAIFGIGLVNGQRNWKTVASIALAWICTLPLAVIIGALLHGGMLHVAG